MLLDLYLSNRYETVVPPETFPFLAKPDYGPAAPRGPGPYRRFEIGEGYNSRRAIPGQAGGMHTATGLEHDETGKPSDQAQMHTRMTEKRHEKLKQALAHPDLTICKRFGDEGPVDVGILGWGSTFGEILEAMLAAQAEGIRCAAMKVVMLSPLPEEPIAEFFADCEEIVVPELNYEGQFANLVSGAIGKPVTRVNCVTGAPMEVEMILERVRALAKTRSAA